MLSALSGSVARWTNHSALRFVVVGVLSVIVDTGSLIVFHSGLGISLPLATALAFAVAFIVNFGLNRLWAFSTAGPMGPQLTRYLSLVAVNLGLTVLFVQALTWLGLPYVLAKLGTAVVLAVLNYAVSRKWIFN